MIVPMLVALPLSTNPPAATHPQSEQVTHSAIGEQVTHSAIGKINAHDPMRNPCRNLNIQFPQCPQGN